MAGSITRVSPSHDPGQTLAPLCRCGRRNRSKHGRPPAPPEGHAEPRSAAGAMSTGDRARSDAERRDRTTADNNEGPAHIGTYACARVLQACSALGGLGHAANRRSGTRTDRIKHPSQGGDSFAWISETAGFRR